VKTRSIKPAQELDDPLNPFVLGGARKIGDSSTFADFGYANSLKKGLQSFLKL